MKCQNCGAELEEGVVFCCECGAKVGMPIRICRECGAKLPDGVKFCSECGSKIAIIDERYSSSSSDESDLSHLSTPPKKLRQEVGKRLKTAQIVEKAAAGGKRFKEHKTMVNYKKILIIAIVAILLIAYTALRAGKSTSSRNTENASLPAQQTEQTIVEEKKISVLNVVEMTCSEAMEALQSAGFTNVTTNVDSDAIETQWIVVKQSVNAGKTIRPSDRIELICAMRCKLYLDLHSEGNLMFSTYDISVTLDGAEVGSIPNGKNFTFLADVLGGDHTLEFCKTGSTSPKATKNIKISNDMTYSCDLGHDSSSIDIKNENIQSNVNGASLEVVDVTGMVLSEAMAKLKEIGFSNLREEPYSDIWDKDNWIVTAQGIQSETIADKNDFIQLDCISLDDYFNNTYVGRNVNGIQELAEISGFVIRFEDSSNHDMNSTIAVMDQQTKENWVAISARQYGGAYKTAVVTISNTNGAVEPLAMPKPTAKPESEKYDIDTGSINASTATTNPEEATMPVMPGTNLDTVIDAAKAFGLSRTFSDISMGHGTKNCTLEKSDNGGLTLDIIYSASTKEVLCGSIVTFNILSSLEEQKEFIRAMAVVLCPERDQSDVTNWVNSNVGGSAETMINGFVYEMDLGSSGNCLYDAGERNWEKWESSLSSD